MRPRTQDGVPTDETRRLWFFESLDRIHRALSRKSDFDEALCDAFDALLDILECDRVWLAYPCDLHAQTVRIVAERTRPGWPGAFECRLELPATSDVLELHRIVLDHDGPVMFGPHGAFPLPASSIAFGARSAAMMAVTSRVDAPYIFGLHRCERDQVWSNDELRLFQEIGRRLGDSLGTASVLRNLREREHQLEHAGRIAQVGYWERDEIAETVTLSAETCRIFDLAANDRTHDIAKWREIFYSRVHADDRDRVANAFDAAIATGTFYDAEYRFRDARGAIKIVHTRAEIVRNAEGRATRLFGTIQDISATRSIEERLLASDALYRAVVDQATDALFVHDDDGRVVDVNCQACESLGYTRDELLGMLPPSFDADVTPELLATIGPRLLSGDTIAFDSHHRRKDGTTFPVEIRIRSFVLGDRRLGVALARDISDRKRTEERLRASEERFRELAETIAEAFWVTDPNKNAMLYISPAYERIWGRSCQSLYESPRSWLEAIHPDDRARVLDAALHKQAQGLYDEEYRIVRPDGEVRWIRDAAFPVRDAAGGVARVVGVARDITDRRNLEIQLLHAQKMEAVGQLAGGVAHDFNNLLGAILMEAELAEDVPHVPDDARGAVGEIRAAAQRAAGLTRQLLLFGRRQALQARPLDLNIVVRELAKMLQRIIGEDIRLDVELSPDALVLLADAGMLEQVLMNLAVNARDAMPRGGTLTISTSAQVFDATTAQRVADAKPGQYAVLSVSDSGEGIPPEVLPRIFEPFFTTKEPGRGTGLGLATTFAIVKEHGGWISVESATGRGTAFAVYLPLKDGAVASSTATAQRPSGGNEVILFVEDEAQLRRGTKKMLERYGYRVIEAESGVEALRMWPEVRGTVSLVLTDIVMPGGIDGYDLAARLRADRPGLAVIFASGYNGDVLARRGDAQRDERFLQKPVSTAQLLHAIRNALSAVR